MSCQICTETFNKSANAIVICSHCSGEACKNCVRTYILGLDDEAKCMFCKNYQDTIFLASNLNKTWVHTDYKKHREKILLDKQIAQLPDTQDKAKRIKLSREFTKEIEVLNNTKKELLKSLKDVNSKVKEHQDQIHNLINENSKKTSLFTFKCSHPECAGFLDNSWVCGLCDSKTCKNCMEIMLEDHECNPDKVETVQLIKKDTKPCPGCGEFIHKINGCDQMWCPTCKVAFSWKTGQIEKGNIHNPEYYRWMRENNEEIIQVRDNNYCGQIPDASFLLRSIRKLWVPSTHNNKIIDDLHVHILYNCHRIVHHIAMLERTHATDINFKDARLEDLRVKYLLNEITKESWMIKIQAQDKAFKKSTDLMNIWRLLRDTVLPKLWYTVEQFHDTTDYDGIKRRLLINVFPQLEKIRLFCNDSFIKIGKMYGSENEIITPSWSNMSFRIYKQTVNAASSN